MSILLYVSVSMHTCLAERTRVANTDSSTVMLAQLIIKMVILSGSF